MKLTNESVARLKLQDGKSERLEFDKDLPGFGIRLRGGGKRTWIVQYRLGTKQRRLTLGSLAAIDATEARRRAKSALANVHLGRDPQMQKIEIPRASGRHAWEHRRAVSPPRQAQAQTPQLC